MLDLGCWPGGWLQVASAVVAEKGHVVGVDLAEIDPPLELENVTTKSLDLTDPGATEEILLLLGGQADVVLCDAAPKQTGIRATDRAREEMLLESVDAQLSALLKPGGNFLIKILDCPEAAVIEKKWRKLFQSAKQLKPKSSRKGTKERYFFGKAYSPTGG